MANAIKQEWVTRITTEIVDRTLRFAFPTDDVDPSGNQKFIRAEVQVDQLPAGILAYAAIHGIKQKLVDAMALGMQTVDGKVRRPTIADKAAEFQRVRSNLERGIWNEEREGPTGGLLYQAIARLYPGKFPDAAAFRKYLDEQAEQRKVKVSAVEDSLRRSPKVAETIDAIKAEMGKPVVDVQDMLDELMK